MEYVHMGIFVIPGSYLIRVYGSVTQAIFFVIHRFLDTVDKSLFHVTISSGASKNFSVLKFFIQLQLLHKVFSASEKTFQTQHMKRFIILSVAVSLFRPTHAGMSARVSPQQQYQKDNSLIWAIKVRRVACLKDSIGIKQDQMNLDL